jgi:catechol 2,3-dioxygenase-like lactoylglutathione lyase family enzyme
MPRIDRRAFLTSLPLLGAIVRPAGGQPATLPFIELDHVSIRVLDVQRSARFYMRLFGTDAARDPKRQANPGSQARELWFIRLGRSHLALAPLSPNEPPGVDHYCLSVSAFAKDAAKAMLAGFDQPYPDWPSNNVWLKDPDGLLLQLAPSANEPQLATIVRNAVAIPRPPDLPATPPFRASRISRLVLPCARADLSASYYRRLLGNGRSSGTSHIFAVGASKLILAEGGTQSFRVAVASFEERSAKRTLRSLGITPEAMSDRSMVELRDPDGIAFEIAAS